MRSSEVNKIVGCIEALGFEKCLSRYNFSGDKRLSISIEKILGIMTIYVGDGNYTYSIGRLLDVDDFFELVDTMMYRYAYIVDRRYMDTYYRNKKGLIVKLDRDKKIGNLLSNG